MPKNLVNLSMSAPGLFGLNLQQSGDVLPPGWATKADNCVFDEVGRLAARKGSKHVNATAISGTPDVRSAFEYIDASGNTLSILAAGNAIYKVSGSTLTDISGTITTPTADNWKFVNFNGKCVGFQSGHAPIVLSAIAGSFADITLSGTQQPTTSVHEVMSAFGRLWVLDGSDLKYSDALDETAWNSLFDLSTVWLNGMDDGVALREFNGHLVIFGRRTIAIYSNPWSASGGGTVDTSVMELVEKLENVGCLARDSVVSTGDDVLFLSNVGVVSLGRTIQEKSLPMRNPTKNVRDKLLDDVHSTALTQAYIKAVYSRRDGFYLLSLPNTSTPKTYCIDMRQPLQDGSNRVTTWDHAPTAFLVDGQNELYFGGEGYISKYTGYKDGVASDGSGGSTYEYLFESGWHDLKKPDYLKMPKRGHVHFYGGNGQTVTLKWAFDYAATFSSRNLTIAPSNNASEYGIAEYGIGEYSGSLLFNEEGASVSRSGRIIKVGVGITISGGAFALQRVAFQVKLGKLLA